MKGPTILLVFVVMFALGIVVAAPWLPHRIKIPASFNVPATGNVGPPKPSTDSPSDDDDAPKWPDDAGTPEQVLYQQPQLMDEAIAKLAPRVAGRTNLYLVTFAGDGDEDVFRNEVDFVERQFSERFDAAGHIITLVNNPQTLTKRPLASLSNLETALNAVAEKMDRDNDILMLFLTSHGSKDHELYVGMDPLPLDQIAPDDLSDALDDTPIRWKVVVISACYSGGFIDALSNPNTMVITAARADRSSFGCGTKSQITDFGRAFFVEGLNHNDTFDAAFAEANELIRKWEDRDHETHSEPQFVKAPPIEEKLKEWRAGLRLGPAVPFRPATQATPANNSLTAAR